MTNHLHGKTIMITGAGSGFGRLIALQCTQQGASVLGVDVDAQRLAEVASEVGGGGGRFVPAAADVTNIEQMREAAALAVSEFGGIDVLVNNAGIMPLAHFADHSAAIDSWHRSVDINIKGVINGIAAAYDQMIAQGRGHVVNISSIYGNAGIAGSGVYSATKAAVGIISDSLRIEAKGKIKVTTVRPTGISGTNLGSGVVNKEAILGLTGQYADRYRENVAHREAETLRASQIDDDSIEYWLIKPSDLADAVVHTINQPWGISLSDVTVRASGEDYIY